MPEIYFILLMGKEIQPPIPMNRAGNLTEITDALGYSEQYVYDKEGRLAEKTDKNGIKTEYAFNLYGAPPTVGKREAFMGIFMNTPRKDC